MPIETDQQSPPPSPAPAEQTEPKPQGEPHGQELAKSNGHGNGTLKLEPNLGTAVGFLRAINPDGRQQLVSIPLEVEPPNTRPIPTGRIFAAGQWDEKRDWIEQQQKLGRNVYFCVNEPKAGLPVDIRKLDETEITNILVICADIDRLVENKEVRAKVNRVVLAVANEFCIPSTEPCADFANETGGGVQVFFDLEARSPVTDRNREQARAAGMGLKAHFERELAAEIKAGQVKVDSVWNIDRIMRVPGTINYPTEGKIKRGRTVSLSDVIIETGRKVRLADLLRKFPPPTGSASGRNGSTSNVGNDAKINEAANQLDWSVLGGLATGEYDRLPEDLRKRFEGKRRADPALDALWLNGTKIVGKDNSGSGRVFGLARALSHAGGFGVMDFGMLSRVWDFTPGTSGIEVNGGRRALARAWARAYSEPAEEAFDDEAKEPSEEEISAAAASAAGGRSVHPRWKEFDRLLEDLRAARDEVRVNNTDVEVYDCNTPDPDKEYDDPFVTNRHTRGEVTMTIAPPERGKTLLAVLTAAAVALEKPEMLTGAYARDPLEVVDWAGDVVLVLNENAGRAGPMLRALENVHGFQRSALRHGIHIYPNRLVIAEMVDRKVTPTSEALRFLRWLIEKRKKAEIALVVLDTLSSAVSGLPENASDAMQPVMDILSDIAVAGFCAVDVCHHPSKSSASTVDAYQGRGSSSTGAAAAQTATLDRKVEDDPTRLVVSLGKMRNRARTGDKEEFKVETWSRQVERARAPGHVRDATVAALKRMTTTEVVAENMARDDQNLCDGAYALDIAARAGTTIRPGGAKKRGPMKGDGSWKSAWSIIYDTHNGVPGGKKSPMTANAARALVARLEARGVLKRVPEGEGEVFKMVPGWEQLMGLTREGF